MRGAAAGELVAERAQQQMGSVRGHDLGGMADGLVLLHGFTHTGSSWRRVTAALDERYRPLTPDLRGHGRRERRAPGLAAGRDRLTLPRPPRRASRSAGTRWGGGSRCTWRSPVPSGSPG